MNNNSIKDLGITTQQLLYREVDGNSNSLGIVTKDFCNETWMANYV